MENICRVKNTAFAVLTAVGGTVAGYLGGWDAALQTLIAAMAVDYITGLAVAGIFKKSKKTGSGALSILGTIFEQNGPDSFSGRVASVLMGSTETTFYTVAVYFGATKIKKTRHALPSALAGDITAFLLSALAVRMFLSR